jgi:hypothetical protein
VPTNATSATETHIYLPVRPAPVSVTTTTSRTQTLAIVRNVTLPARRALALVLTNASLATLTLVKSEVPVSVTMGGFRIRHTIYVQHATLTVELVLETSQPTAPTAKRELL